jgi:hypothetical protein
MNLHHPIRCGQWLEAVLRKQNMGAASCQQHAKLPLQFQVHNDPLTEPTRSPLAAMRFRNIYARGAVGNLAAV